MKMKENLETYGVEADGVHATVKIYRLDIENVPTYEIRMPVLDIGTDAALREMSEIMAKSISISVDELSDPRKIRQLKNRFHLRAQEVLKEKFPEVSFHIQKVLAGILLHNMMGLGEIELLLADNWLEEIAINNSQFPITVYHKKYGWLKTTQKIENEEDIYNFASQIGRKVGRQITSLTPLMDAHLLTGDRVAATLFPVSTAGNTITIRRFARSPWTIISLIKNGTTSKEIVAFIWLAVQYELNVMVVGGTASGKTSFLNAISIFIPPSQRVLSIEDTREIELSEPQRWNWVPLSSRAANPEGQGAVSMLDLLVASLRMRPDRIVVGEIRKREQAETMFEAMHTGHSVYTTMHADTVDQIKRRLLEPPMSIPRTELEALHLFVVQYRDRRKNIRKTLEVAEVVEGAEGKDLATNFVYRWRPRTDEFEKAGRSVRVFGEMSLHIGMTQDDFEEELRKKENILQWLIDQEIQDVSRISKIMELYYRDASIVEKAAREKIKFEEVFPESLLNTNQP
jgi:archaeal flagellar protein FlaI